MTTQKKKQAGAEQIEAAVKAGQETVDQAVKNGAEAFNAGYDQAVQAAKEQLEKVFPSAVPNFDQLAAFHRGNLDAMLAAGNIVVKGFETIGREVFAYNQKAVEIGTERATALMACKSLNEAVEMQTGFARENVEAIVAEGTKLSELSVKVAKETAEPLGARVNEAIETFSKPLAA